LLSLMKFLKGNAFAQAMINDALPYDVPNSPTIDHSVMHRQLSQTASRTAVNTAEAMSAIIERDLSFQKVARAYGQATKWGSQAWTVSAAHSASGHAMLWTSPMVGFGVPANTAQIHLTAPGLSLTGISFVGVPGIVMGHNDRIAFGVTSGLVVQTDTFIEVLNPENQYQYKHNGQWKDMEVRDETILVRQSSGELAPQNFKVCRTVHGPVVQWALYNHQAFTRCCANSKLEITSYMRLLDANRVSSVEDFREPIRSVASSLNFTVADVEGNIGHFLSGRLPRRHPSHDYRLPILGTGEYDWQGMDIATDKVMCINPPEGWVGNFNNKPTVSVPGWWPEYSWGQKILDILDQHKEPVDWQTFLNINRANGEHHMGCPFLKPFMLEVLQKYKSGDPRLEEVYRRMNAWEGTDLPGDPIVLIFNEWLLEAMVEVLKPDFGGLVERSLSQHNLQIFGILAFRILNPDRAGFKLQGEYLHGRDRLELAKTCLNRILDKLTEAHGSNIAHWPYKPENLGTPELGPFPNRLCGTYWMACEMTTPIRAFDMAYPGVSALHHSPHFKDQLELFLNWRLRPVPYTMDQFPPKLQ
jgi:penicillin G amidase